MTRALPEWIGATPDTPVPDRVKLRVFDRANEKCQICTRPLRRGHWDTDHIKAIINGGANRESNLQAVCVSPCHSDKTRADVAEKSKVYARRRSHVGLRKAKHLIPGSKGTAFKKKISGEVVRR